MLFNSLQFIIFFPLTLLLFYLLPVRFRWILLLMASLWFYMAWKTEYIFLLLTVCLVNYVCAIALERSDSIQIRKRILWLALLFDMGTLFLFKYYGFVSDNLNALFSFTGIDYHAPVMRMILPMGISFYTFQIMGYVIDVYRRQLPAERNFGFFTLFVTFFPQLVAGPIERAGNLIAQLKDLRNKVDAKTLTSGAALMAMGFFKKLVVADRLCLYVDKVYLFPEGFEGFQVLIATLFFAIQIYCDFSGYTDIAIGCAMLLGVHLMYNFRSPYMSASVSEFWSRWHISLSTWFRDYLYIPLGGNRVVKWRWYYNLYITFVISGFWHGANWTFIVWGALHGTYLVVGLILNQWLKGKFINKETRWMRPLKVLITFTLVCFAWIFFRADSMQSAWIVITKIGDFFAGNSALDPVIKGFGVFSLTLSVGSIMLLFVLESERIRNVSKGLTASMIMITFLVALTLCFGVMGSKSFIYFQF
ncbi:MAG: MBOAT family O-acyltransferase [Bacteroidota bacterium]